MKQQVEYLGFIISKEGLKMNPNRTEKIEKFPKPTNVTETQRFLGLCNYYRRYVKDYAKHARPLYNLTKTNQIFIWSENCEKAFQFLKKCLITPPILIYPDFNETFIVTTDASDVAVGAVISQGSIPNDRPIQYFSKVLNQAQIKYSTIEKELLAIVLAVENFRHYLYGKEFLIITDHKPLVYLFNVKNTNSRLFRWRIILMEYRFQIMHRQGSQNVVADALSRVKEETENQKSIISAIQTRSKSNESKEENLIREKSKYYYIEENNNFIFEDKNHDHIFTILSDEKCELKKKLEKKLNKTIKWKSETIYEINKNHSVIILKSIIRTKEDIEIADKIIHETINLCINQNYENVIVNIDFNDFLSYFNVKTIFQKYLSNNTNIKLSFYLNKVIEVTDPNDIQTILDTYHKGIFGGHNGMERMKNSIRKYYNWFNMTKDIKNYIKIVQRVRK